MKPALSVCLYVVALVGGYAIAGLLFRGEFSLPDIGYVAFVLAFVALCRQHRNGGAA